MKCVLSTVSVSCQPDVCRESVLGKPGIMWGRIVDLWSENQTRYFRWPLHRDIRLHSRIKKTFYGPSSRRYLSIFQILNRAMVWSKYVGRLKSSWIHLITEWEHSRVAVTDSSKYLPWQGCTSYNAPPTSRKRAADRWSLRNFLPRSSLFMVREAQKSHGARSGRYGGCSSCVPPIRFF
jgi:hypothetical protein